MATLTNTGTSALPVNGIVLLVVNANQYALTNSCGTEVAVGSAGTISVVFKPTSPGQKLAYVRFALGRGAATPALVPSTGLAGL